MNPAKLRWGLIFIAVGGMLLAVKAGWLTDYYWWELLQWWPLLLIGLGIEKIFKHTKYRMVSYLTPVALVLFMVYLAVEVGSETGRSGYFSRMRWYEDADPAVKMIEATIDHGRNEIRISRSLGHMAEVRADRYMRKPDVDYDLRDSVALIEVDQGLSGGTLINFSDHRRSKDWTVGFSEDVPLKLTCRGKDSDLNLLMGSIPLRNLIVKNDDGDIYLKLGDASPEVLVRIEGDDARFVLRLPEEAGLKAQGENYSAYFKEIGLVASEGSYMTPGFDTLAVKVDLSITDHLRHLSIESY